MEKSGRRKCDFITCSETAQWHRMLKGVAVKLCTHHYANLGKERQEKPFDRKSILLLEEKNDVVYFQCPNCEWEGSMPLEEALAGQAGFLCPLCNGDVLQV